MISWVLPWTHMSTKVFWTVYPQKIINHVEKTLFIKHRNLKKLMLHLFHNIEAWTITQMCRKTWTDDQNITYKRCIRIRKKFLATSPSMSNAYNYFFGQYFTKTSLGGQIDASVVVLYTMAMFLGCFGRLSAFFLEG